MDKTKLKLRIACHPLQAAIIELVINKDIDGLTLRAIGDKIGIKSNSPQKVKHHLTQLVKYGFLDIVGGKYVLGKYINNYD